MTVKEFVSEYWYLLITCLFLFIGGYIVFVIAPTFVPSTYPGICSDGAGHWNCEITELTLFENVVTFCGLISLSFGVVMVLVPFLYYYILGRYSYGGRR